MAPRTSLVVALSLLACLAATGAAAPGIPKAIPTAKLALMPLPLAAYGREAAGLKLDAHESGVTDNAQAAEDTTDPNDSAASLAAAGRITGFDVTFADYNLFDKPGKLAYVSAGVELYGTAAQGAKGVARSLRDAVSDDPTIGFVLISSSRFAAPGLGEDARGIRVAAKLGAARVWFTGVIFRRGALTAAIAVLRTDAKSENALALRLAHALSSRIEDVLAGRITTPPAKLPAEEKSSPVTKPSVEIASAALTSADVNGAKVKRQEYVRDDDAVSAYEREFDTVTYGRSRLLNVESDVTLYASAADATLFLDAIQGVFNPASRSFRAFIASAFTDGAGFKLKSFSVLHRKEFTLAGTKGSALILRLVTPLGRLDTAYVFMRTGKLVGSLVVVSSPNAAIETADLTRLYSTLANHMQATGKHLVPVA